jgi:hypothetical protein
MNENKFQNLFSIQIFDMFYQKTTRIDDFKNFGRLSAFCKKVYRNQEIFFQRT